MTVVKMTQALALLPTVGAFLAPYLPPGHPPSSRTTTRMSAHPFDHSLDRSTLIKNVAVGLLGTAVVGGGSTDFQLIPGVNVDAYAAESAAQASPIAVVGAGGKTGKLVVEGLLRRGKAVRTVTRTGEFALKSAADNSGVLSTSAGDVTKIDSLKEALAGCSAVLFCASASKKGGSAEAVDYKGLLNTGQACVDLGIPRLVVISSMSAWLNVDPPACLPGLAAGDGRLLTVARNETWLGTRLGWASSFSECFVPGLHPPVTGAVTKPDSVGFKVTNLFGNIVDDVSTRNDGLSVVVVAAPLLSGHKAGSLPTNLITDIMTFKRKGEVELEDMYARAPKGITYTIVRPGGLADGPVIGPKGLELNQGDTIGGVVNRADVAEVVVEAALSPAAANTVFEVYDKKTAGPLQSGLAKPSGYEITADTYQAMLEGLKQGVGM